MARAKDRPIDSGGSLVALLRGINVGGRHRVTMADLRSGLAARGLTGVRTYIASGNIVVDAPPGRNPIDRVRDLVQATVAEDFGFSCAVLVRSGTQMRRIAEAIPRSWEDPTLRADVLYLFDDADVPEVLADLTVVADVDTVAYVPGAILWCAPKDRLTRSGMSRMVGTPLYPLVTVRSMRTALALAALADPDGGPVGGGPPAGTPGHR